MHAKLNLNKSLHGLDKKTYKSFESLLRSSLKEAGSIEEIKHDHIIIGITDANKTLEALFAGTTFSYIRFKFTSCEFFF